MKFYEQLQLNQLGSKNYIRESPNKKERNKRIAIYIFKVFLTVLFCVLFVTCFTKLFGVENGTPGVVILLFLMAFRQVDLGIKPKEGVAVMLLIGVLLTFAPHLAASLPPEQAFFVHFPVIFILMLFGCHQIRYYNQATIILSYLLLFGYDVSGELFIQRVVGLLLGFAWTSWLLYRVHCNKQNPEGIADIFRSFSLGTVRSRWQLGLALTTSLALVIGEMLGFSRVMWIGLAALSIVQPTKKEQFWRAKNRFIGVVAGVLLFIVMIHFLPASILGGVGIIGGICVGFSTHYGWQSAFNCFGALSIAAALLGLDGALFYRILDTAFGIIFALCIYNLLDHFFIWTHKVRGEDPEMPSVVK